MECLLTMRRIYETERGDPRCSPKRGFVLSPKPGAPDVCGHKPFRLQPAGHPPRASTPFADSPRHRLPGCAAGAAPSLYSAQALSPFSLQ